MKIVSTADGKLTNDQENLFPLDDINGWLILDKPAGKTSTAVLNEIGKILQAKKRKIKIGHAGTLDPFATGILLVAFGEATKTVEYAMSSSKAYEFSITWGENRDTLDVDGKITETSDKIPTASEISSVLPSFVGDLQQIPPNYSAIKVAGVRAYSMARKGELVKLEPRQVTCYKLDLLEDNQTSSKFLVKCSKGFYVRSIARDIASKLGAFGYVSYLRRVVSGNFTINDTITLDSLKEILYTTGRQELARVLKPVSVVLDGILVQHVSLPDAQKLKQGQKLSYKGEDCKFVLVKCNGTEVAICKALDGVIMPIKVFNLKLGEN